MSQHRYPTVESQPSFPALERDILSFWDRDHTFEASVARRDGADEYVFYDGPPFANGLPHYGHLLTGFVKDAVPRYRTRRVTGASGGLPRSARRGPSSRRSSGASAGIPRS
ncbi:MAG: class I tRNA ligase family protein [Ilumatobacteraceae bacterium]